MIVFCPNCGTQNPGIPGARATCTACSSTFEVPGEAGSSRPPPVAAPPQPTRDPAPPPPSFGAPGAQIFATAPVRAAGGGGGTNTLAIVSLVAGIICCIPFVSPGLAIGCGIGALRQLDVGRDAQSGRGLAIAGIILGALAALVQLLGMIGSVGRRF